MRDRVGEALELLVRCLQLGRALQDPLLELVVEAANFCFVATPSADVTEGENAAGQLAANDDGGNRILYRDQPAILGGVPVGYLADGTAGLHRQPDGAFRLGIRRAVLA